MGTSSSTQKNPSPKTPQNKQIFILAGQSNMSGRGGVTKRHRWDGVVPPECQPNPDSILRLAADLRWDAAEEPLHADIDSGKVCGVGPGMAFANAVAEAGVVVALVPCAVGGTAIRRWGRGQRLYENMVRRARESLKGGGEIRALLWFQGESDTSNLKDALHYKENMEKLIGNVREDLGLPLLPIIQVVIATGEGKYIDKVREAQIEVGINLPNVVSVDAKGLQVKEDHLHLTTEAQVKLGQLLANAYLSHFATPQQSSWFMQVLGFGRQIFSTLFPL